MADYQRREIFGRWRKGYALDIHTISSTYLGQDAFGHDKYDTIYSAIGELLYKLKSKQDTTVIPEIVDAVEQLIKSADKSTIDIIVPVPPSSLRRVQPVILLAEAVSQRVGIPLVNCITKTRAEPQLKNIYDLDERLKRLTGLHTVDQNAVQGKRVLLFDDLYRSGATMNAITAILLEQGKAIDVCALTITKTRSNR